MMLVDRMSAESTVRMIEHGKLGMLAMMLIFHQFTIPAFQASLNHETLNLD
jgi:hypothetical protein